ncbi:hypothetical protein GRAN_2588 [Granulicella sibirica]|uniref:Uncharacterized protein n=1 Tax=Granulicella sibirica TaxID=2479048 RepID=A0A4Q0T2E6_9BACT|nr:hypothetical protein GRAN_2588 [Granulicella sibirica]
MSDPTVSPSGAGCFALFDQQRLLLPQNVQLPLFALDEMRIGLWLIFPGLEFLLGAIYGEVYLLTKRGGHAHRLRRHVNHFDTRRL